MNNKSTIYDVAAKAKVSNATVSRALNTPDKVKPETRDKILKAAKELGYKANVFAKGLASSKSTQVAVILNDLARASVAEMVKGIAEVANTYDYSILLFPGVTDDKCDSLLQNLLSYQVDGILYLNDEITPKQLNLINELTVNNQIPLVLVNTDCENGDNLLSVAIDYEKAGYEATKALIQEGRKDVALLTTKKKYQVSELKKKGYLRAIENYNLEPKICYTSGNLKSNKVEITNFLKENQIDGVIGVRDSIAIACMNILLDMGKNIPEDVSIFGFQNTRYTLLCRPQLSTINIPIYEIGARAMEILTLEMTGEEQEQKGKVLLEHSIIKRETTR